MAEQILMEGLEAVEKPKRTRKTAVKTETTEEKPKTTRTRKAKTETASEEVVEKVEKTTKTVKKTTKKATKSTVQEFLGTGRRKTSVARVRLTVGTGSFKVNGQDLEKYFDLESLIYIAKQPLTLTELANSVDVRVNVYGGGMAGQAGAVRHGVTKALLEFRPELRTELKKAGFITRDARAKERKKYGLKKARKAPQFSKR